MHTRDTPNHISGWEEEDFVESPSPIAREDDPWTDSSDYGEPAVAQSWGEQLEDTTEDLEDPQDYDESVVFSSDGNPSTDRTSGVRPSGEHSGIVEAASSNDNDVSAPEIDWYAEESDTYDSDDELPIEELEIVQELVGGKSINAGGNLDDYIGGFNEPDRDEPEPQEEYDPGLSEPLYTSDNSVTDLSRDIKIDELLARISHANETQRLQITEFLLERSVGRLRHWLPWLRSRAWTGDSLLLFLEFRNLWDNNRQWWEWTYWDKFLECWHPRFVHGSLTLDDSYVLIHLRLDRRVNEIIDRNWLDEWAHFGLWQFEFPSFARFALFRAWLGDDEEWRNKLGLYDDDSYEDDEIQNHYHYRKANGNWVVVWNGVGTVDNDESSYD